MSEGLRSTPHAATCQVYNCNPPWRCTCGHDERRQSFASSIRRGYLFEVLVGMYRQYPCAVASMCDEWLDSSGQLLGEVREEALLRD